MARDAATVTKLASMARITITTSSSTSVKAERGAGGIPVVALRVFMWAGEIPALALWAFMGDEGIPAVAVGRLMAAEEIPALALRAFICMVCIVVLTKDR
jgi:hypothetical protein